MGNLYAPVNGHLPHMKILFMLFMEHYWAASSTSGRHTVVNATVICSLGHGLRTFTTMPRSTQPCIPPGSLNGVLASAKIKAGMSPLSGGSKTGVCGM